jgi:hypothetical protein
MPPQYLASRVTIDGLANIEEACQKTSGIRFYDGNRLIEGEIGDGVRRVLADARKLLHSLD